MDVTTAACKKTQNFPNTFLYKASFCPLKYSLPGCYIWILVPNEGQHWYLCPSLLYVNDVDQAKFICKCYGLVLNAN